MMVRMADFINWEVMLDADQTGRYAGSHVDALSKMFVDAQMIASESDDDYDGHDSLVLLFAPANPNIEPKIVLITSYFGSCSGCDMWEDADDEDLRELLTAIANNARLFDSFEEIDAFFDQIIKMMESEEPYGEFYELHGHIHSLRKQVKEAEIKLGNGSVA